LFLDHSIHLDLIGGELPDAIAQFFSRHLQKY
jgi:hypothetical protein